MFFHLFRKLFLSKISDNISLVAEPETEVASNLPGATSTSGTAKWASIFRQFLSLRYSDIFFGIFFK